MADTKISEAADGNPAQASDSIPVGRAGSPTRVSAQSVADLASVPASFPISSVTLLQAALDNRALLVHTHPIGSVVLLQTTLDGKADLVHTHDIASVTLLQTTLDGKATTAQGLPAGGAAGASLKKLSGTDYHVSWLSGIEAHAATHQFLGDDQISVANLTGLLATPQTPAVHTHPVGSVTFLSDVRLLGRSAGSAGAGQEITVGAGLSLAAGALTATGGGGGDSTTIVRLTSATSTGSALEAGVDVTQLTFDMAANADYLVDVRLFYQSAALTTGIGLGLRGPASPVAVAYDWWTYTAVGTPLHRYGTRFGTANPVTTAVGFINSNVMATLQALIRNGVNAGSCTLIFRSEIATSNVTIQSGSILSWRKLT